MIDIADFSNQIPAFNLGSEDVRSGLFVKAVTHTPAYTMLSGIPHTHNFYTISLLKSGQSTLYTNFSPVLIQAPALLLLGKDQIHIHAPEPTFEATAISFLEWITVGLPEGWDTLFDGPGLPLSIHELARLEQYTELLKAEITQPGAHRVDTYLLSIIIRIGLDIKARQDQSTPVPSSLYHAFLRTMRNHYRTHVHVSFYADSLRVTKKQLDDAVRLATGRSAKRILLERKILEAKRLLYWARLPMKEVAWQLGFSSDAYFTRFFKKYEGMTPTEFQNNLQKIKGL